MTDEQIAAPNQAERLRVMIAALSDSGQGCFSKESLRAILALVDAQAAEIARLRETVALLHNVIARAALAQETQP
jgi:hypothetical protein